MSNVIDLLGMIGQDARWRHGSPSDMKQALLRTQIDPEVQAAILAKDQSRLQTFAGGSNAFCAPCPSIECMVMFGMDTDEDDRESRQCA